MRIGLFVYSQTGNTLSVAMRLQDKLRLSGHECQIERLAPVGDERLTLADATPGPELDVRPYDALVLAAPVQGFRLAPAMSDVLKKLPSLNGKPVVCFVTMFFRYSWLGGNHAISQFRQAVGQHKGQLIGTGIINWSGKQREKQIEHLIGSLADSLQSNS